MEAPLLTPPMNFKRGHSAEKVMASIFWYIQGVIIIDYLERGRMINGAYYTGEFRLLHDNAPTQTLQVAMTAAAECGFEIFPHPQYSPDMSLSDFYLFPKLKSHLRGTHYGSYEGVIEAVNEYFGDQEKSLYFEEIRKLEQRWAKYIAY